MRSRRSPLAASASSRASCAQSATCRPARSRSYRRRRCRRSKVNDPGEWDVAQRRHVRRGQRAARHRALLPAARARLQDGRQERHGAGVHRRHQRASAQGRASSTSICATTRCSSRSRRPKRRRSPSQSWSRTRRGGGSAFAAPIVRRILDRYLLTPEQWAEQEAKRKPAPPVATPTNTE